MSRRAYIRSLHQELLGRDLDYAALDRKAAGLAHLSAKAGFDASVESDEYRQRRAWNEIYCLHAFLQGHAGWEIVFFNDWFARAHRTFLERHMPLFLANPGGSLWLRKRA